MADRILQTFLERQYEEGMALARGSDILELTALPQSPPRRYVAELHCRGLVLAGSSNGRPEVVEKDNFGVGVWFHPNYLRDVEPFRSLRLLWPANVFHPNISDKLPVICPGHALPGMGLVDLLYQVFEIITYQKVTMAENDALNKQACAWARRNQDRFPVDRRPLKRRRRAFSVAMRRSPADADGS